MRRIFDELFGSDARYTNILLLLFLIVTKLIYTLNIDSFGWDGSYYYGIARNIRQGFGYMTNVSLYHQGMTYFPHPTPVYPLWPYVLGYISYLVSLEIVAFGLPVLLYFSTIIVAYKLIQKHLPENIISTKYFVINYAHVGVFIFFLHGKFFEVTSKPYTESLAYFVLFICLTRLTSILSSTKATTFLEIGIWSAVLFLLRSQFLIFFISILFFYSLMLFISRRLKYLRGIFLVVIGFLVSYAPQLFYLLEELGQVNLATLLFFDQYQASPTLSPLHVFVKYPSFAMFLYYKLYGFMIAFSPWGKYSYSMTFHGFQYSFIGMLLVAPTVYFSQGERFSKTNIKLLYAKAQEMLRSPEKTFVLFLITFACISFLSIHALHKTLWKTWNFPTRHALVCSFLFFFGFVYLLRYQPYIKVRKITLMLFLLSTLVGVGNIMLQTVNQVYSSNFLKKNANLIHWFKGELSRRSSLSIVMPNPQKISAYANDVNFHWIYYNTSRKDFHALFTKLGADYLLLPPKKYKKFTRKINNFEELFIKHKRTPISGFFILSPSQKLLTTKLSSDFSRGFNHVE